MTLAISFVAAAAARADGPEEAEALAQVRDGESATLDLQTIRRYGDVVGRFEVALVWTDSTRPMPADYSPRRVRYMANCEEGTMTIAAVGVFDPAGRVQKTIVVPPRASDPVTPEKGTEAAKWLRRVCMF
jgi:hypothetical protein